MVQLSHMGSPTWLGASEFEDVGLDGFEIVIEFQWEEEQVTISTWRKPFNILLPAHLDCSRILVIKHLSRLLT